MHVKIRIHYKELKSVFRYCDADEKAMLVHFARMCVLYEDMNIEYAGAEAERLEAFDGTSSETRRFYFVRKSLGTLAEVEQAINVLQMNKAFKALKKGMGAEPAKSWDQAVKFFAKHHEFMSNWRDDTGGHFLQRAAEYAIDNIEDRNVASIEFYRRGSGADVRLPFAYSLVAIALTRQKPTTQTVDDFITQSFTFLGQAYRHAHSAIQVVIHTDLANRFRG